MYRCHPIDVRLPETALSDEVGRPPFKLRDPAQKARSQAPFREKRRGPAVVDFLAYLYLYYEGWNQSQEDSMKRSKSRCLTPYGASLPRPEMPGTLADGAGIVAARVY